MFPLHFHYEDVSRQDPLLKPNHANVMDVPGLCEIRVVPKAAPSSFIIKNGKLAMEIPCGQKLIRTRRGSIGKSFRSNPFLGSNKDKGYVNDLARQSTLRGHGMFHFLVRISTVMLISFQENYARTRGEEIRRFFFFFLLFLGSFWWGLNPLVFLFKKVLLFLVCNTLKYVPGPLSGAIRLYLFFHNPLLALSFDSDELLPVQSSSESRDFWESHDLNAIQSWMQQPSSSANIPVNPQMDEEVDQPHPAIARMVAEENTPEYQEVARISRLCESWEERIMNHVHNTLPQRGIILEDPEDVKRALSLFFFDHYQTKEPQQRLSFLRSTFRVLQRNPQSKRWTEILDEIKNLNP